MKNLSPSFIAVTVCLALYSVNSSADSLDTNLETGLSSNPSQCYINVPVFNKTPVQGDVNSLPINISADQFEAVMPNQAIYQGNVTLTQGNREVSADKITVANDVQDVQNVFLDTNVLFQDNFIQMKGDDASINLDTHAVQIANTQYHLVGRLGRGNASKITFNENRFVELKNGSFTSCPVDDNSWLIEGSTIIHDNDEQLLEVWNAVFRVGKVPVLYAPYLQLPTGDKRRSGILIPKFDYDNINGIDFALPIYWNIAQNYDATFTPRIMEKRGFQLQTEFRYLNALGLGTLAFDWLDDDRIYNGKNDYRWLFHWKNEELINENWRFEVNATRISDNQYLTDLGSSYASETDGYLTQLYRVGFNNQNWDIDLNYQYFQGLHDSLKENLYRIEPQLNIRYYSDYYNNFRFKNFTQASRFVSSGDKNPKTWRFHTEPTINYSLISSWSSISAEAGILATHYDQDLPSINNHPELDKSINRVIPKFNIDGKIIFEREVDTFAGYTQTLEPRVRYSYTAYRDQSSIGNYDSSLLQSDYIGLFRDSAYSGLDRIASANKIATGITTRFYDENKVERFNLSIGQVNHFTHSRTGSPNSPLDQNKDTGSITWATDSYWRVNDNIILRNGLQYDTRINEVSLANTIFEYRTSEQKMVQLSYRYANKNYIDSVGLANSEIYPYTGDLSQLGIMTTWPLTENVTAIGSYYYDTENKQTTDSFIGIHYADCCWGISLQYGRKIIDWEQTTESSKYENKFSVSFELRGLTKNSNAIVKMLDFGLLPYNTAFEQDYGTK